jgi:REP element-mobilizing transposase RayT
VAHTFARLLIHIVFSTKDRRPWIQDPLRARTHAYLGGIVTQVGGRAVVVGGVADHVHLLVDQPPRFPISDLVRDTKANSSAWMRMEFPGLSAFAWQTGYGAFSVSSSNAGRVERYIATQEEHHRTQTFQEEFEALLRRHQLRADDPYLWE